MALMIFTLTGCQLAREDGVIQEGKDRLIGAFVSYDYIDLFDFENYMQDNFDASNGEIIIEGDTTKYNGRLYATILEEEVKSVNGDFYTIQKYVFKGVEGVGLASPVLPDPLRENDTYRGMITDSGFTDLDTMIKVMDEEEGIELEGTIYVPSETLSNSICINPIYQSTDGKVYLVSGSGFSSTSNVDMEGETYSQTIKDSTTVTNNNKTKINSSSIKVTVKTMYPVDSVSYIQMNDNNQMVKEDTWKPEEVPEGLTVEDGTDYIIVETIKIKPNQEKNVERTIYTKKDQNIEYFASLNDKLFEKLYTEITWGE